jgi:hypothetical protein
MLRTVTSGRQLDTAMEAVTAIHEYMYPWWCGLLTAAP